MPNEIIRLLELIRLGSLHGNKMQYAIEADSATGKTVMEQQFKNTFPDEVFVIPSNASPYTARKMVQLNQDKELCIIDDISNLRESWESDYIQLMHQVCDGRVQYKTKFEEIDFEVKNMSLVLIQNPKASKKISDKMDSTGLNDRLVPFRFKINPSCGAKLMQQRYLAKNKGKLAKIEFEAHKFNPIMSELTEKDLNEIFNSQTLSRQPEQMAILKALCLTYGYEFNKIMVFIGKKEPHDMDFEYSNEIVDDKPVIIPAGCHKALPGQKSTDIKWN